MKTCKNCENFYDGGPHFHCSALNTRCDVNVGFCLRAHAAGDIDCGVFCKDRRFLSAVSNI